MNATLVTQEERELWLGCVRNLPDDDLCLEEYAIKRLFQRLDYIERKLHLTNRELDECGQIAGLALEYPKFCADQKNFPGTTEKDGVCIGEHTNLTIVEELAKRFTEKTS